MIASQVTVPGLAEELAQDALVDALVQWPDKGTPRNPGAWLMTVGKRKAIDRFRRDRNFDDKYSQLGRDGLTTAESARAYLEPEATVKQRILRAKRAISKAGVPF